MRLNSASKFIPKGGYEHVSDEKVSLELSPESLIECKRTLSDGLYGAVVCKGEEEVVIRALI